ncbi:hypothetical protein GCM10023145_26860 [Angustibacter luteus]
MTDWQAEVVSPTVSSTADHVSTPLRLSNAVVVELVMHIPCGCPGRGAPRCRALDRDQMD